MPRWSRHSTEQLASAHKDLQLLFNVVIQTYDCKVLEGHRSMERQLEAYNSGHSKVKRGKHNYIPSLAVDVAPYPVLWPDSGGISKSEAQRRLIRFYHFAGYVKGIADTFYTDEVMEYRLRWGGDWDRDFDFTDQSFNDLVHFELVT